MKRSSIGMVLLKSCEAGENRTSANEDEQFQLTQSNLDNKFSIGPQARMRFDWNSQKHLHVTLLFSTQKPAASPFFSRIVHP